MPRITYRNPVIPGFHPDPSVCRLGEDFYLATSTFEYFPAVPIFHSRDLVHWKLIGHALDRPEQLNLEGTPSSGGIFAPTLRHHEGRFYLVTTDTTGIDNFLVWAEDPAGPWSNPVRIPLPGVDPSLMFESDGRCLYTYHAVDRDDPEEPWGIWQNEIDPLSGQPQKDQSQLLWRGTGGKFPEGPHLYRIGDWYYLLIAEGGTEYNHCATVARAPAAYGPFEPCPGNPILSHAGKSSPIQSTGHADLVADQHGRWWAVFLGTRPLGYPPMHHLGRETFLAPVTWDTHGWPRVNDGRIVELQMTVDGLPPAPVDPEPVRDEFDAPSLRLSWNFRRNPDLARWSLSSRPSCLSLGCAPTSLSDARSSPTFVGRRQQHIKCRAETRIDFEPTNDQEEAGLTVFMNERHHTDLFLTRRDGQRCVVMRRTIGSLSVEVFREPISEEALRLSVTADERMYHLSYRSQGQTEHTTAGQAEVRHHCTELCRGFTGVYLGLYATANGTQSQNEAHFDWFDYEPLDRS